MTKLTSVLILFAATLTAQPVISPGGIQDAGSYSDPIAQGSVFVVKGRNLGPAGIVYGSVPYPQDLSGVSIRFSRVAGGGGVSQAYLVYSYNVGGVEQLAAILPSQTPEGTYDVTVTYNGQTSAAARTTVVRRRFGIITVDGSGRGRAVIQNYVSQTQVDLNRFTIGRIANFTAAPATPGQTLILWGTGLGPTLNVADNVLPGGGQNYLSSADVRVYVGGMEIRPFYAGRAPGLPGADQINFTLPEVPNLPMGCTVPVQVSVDNQMSNIGTVAIAQRGSDSCTHKLFVPSNNTTALRKLDQGGLVTAGLFYLVNLNGLSNTGVESSLDFVQGAFSRYNADQAADLLGLETDFRGCTLVRRRSTLDGLVFGDPTSALDAGNPLNLAGPALQTTVPRLSGNFYGSGLSANAVRDGSFSITGPGGADVVNPFTATVNAPTRLVWTNRAALSQIDRDSGFTVRWEGGTGAQGGAVSPVAIVGMSGSVVGGTLENPVFDATMFICNSEGPAQQFTVPAAFTRLIPATSSSNSLGAVMVISTTRGPSFGATLGQLQSTDAGYLFLQYASIRPVTFTGGSLKK